jgi:hypothetical protein
MHSMKVEDIHRPRLPEGTQTPTELIFLTLERNRDFMSNGDKIFTDSLKSQYNANGHLSTSQEYHLDRIALVYSDGAVHKIQSWCRDYNNEMRLTATRCAHYYNMSFPRYYESIIDKVLADPHAHTLTPVEYKKLCENKYAKKVLSCYEADPKFAIGELVQLRSTHNIFKINDRMTGPVGHYTEYKNRLCLITSDNARAITRAAKGSRVYKILFIGESIPVFAHESDLKTAKRKM